MEILKYCKLQLAFLILLSYIGYLFIVEGNQLNERLGKEFCNHLFDRLFILGDLCIVFDGITAYTVNHLYDMPIWINDVAHTCHYIVFQVFIFMHFLYWLDIAGIKLQNVKEKILVNTPLFLCIAGTVFFMPNIKYV